MEFITEVGTGLRSDLSILIQWVAHLHLLVDAISEFEGGTVARGITLHDQGGHVEIVTDDAEPRTYRLELEQRVYSGERRVEVLKLAVYGEDDDEKSLAYTWSEPESTNIGMNLRWFQAGCTKK